MADDSPQSSNSITKGGYSINLCNELQELSISQLAIEEPNVTRFHQLLIPPNDSAHNTRCWEVNIGTFNSFVLSSYSSHVLSVLLLIHTLSRNILSAHALSHLLLVTFRLIHCLSIYTDYLRIYSLAYGIPHCFRAMTWQVLLFSALLFLTLSPPTQSLNTEKCKIIVLQT